MDAGRNGAGSDQAPRVMRLLYANGRAAWMLVGILVAVGLLGYAFSKVKLILLAIFVAVVHAAVMTPIANWLEDRGLGRATATALSLLLVVGALGTTTGVVVYRLFDQLPTVTSQLEQRQDELVSLLGREPLSMTEAEIDELLDRGAAEVASQATGGETDAAMSEEDEGGTAADAGSDTDASGSPATGTDDADGTATTDDANGTSTDDGIGDGDESTADDGEGPSPQATLAVLKGSAAGLQVLGYASVGLVLSFFLVRDRRRITRGVVRHLAGSDHDASGRRVLQAAWEALDGYVRASVIVGALEGAVIGATLLVVGTPLAGALAFLTFVAAFVPVVGATVAGLLAVGVTWLAVGGVEALIVGAVVVLVQQFDSNVLQPTIVATHTQLHPAATIVALMLGGLVGGILGALLAVPVAAVLVAVAGELLDPDAGSPTDTEPLPASGPA
jgi:predicted PurR-regulated permease PerM